MYEGTKSSGACPNYVAYAKGCREYKISNSIKFYSCKLQHFLVKKHTYVSWRDANGDHQKISAGMGVQLVGSGRATTLSLTSTTIDILAMLISPMMIPLPYC